MESGAERAARIMKRVALATFVLAASSAPALGAASSHRPTFLKSREPRLAHATESGGILLGRRAHPSASAAFSLAEKHCEAFGKVSVFNTYPDKRRVKFWCGN